MGIYIKGLKAPDSCSECRMSRWSNIAQHYVCDVCSEIVATYVSEYESTKPDWCPVKDVKEPHGDLIDRDALNASIKELRKIKPLYKLNKFWELEGTEILNLIMGSQTVVEAEWSEDE